MKNYKKRTLALILGTVISVAGSFATENYKNSLTGINFETSTSGDVNVVLQTRNNSLGSISPIKRDANTYIIMLPETNSEASTPDLNTVSGNIQSVNIRTMPYSNNAKGYTRITIKTINPSLSLSATNQVYIPSINKSSAANIQDARKAIAQKAQKTQKESIQEKRKMIAKSLVEKQNSNLDSKKEVNADSSKPQVTQLKQVERKPIVEETKPSNNLSLVYFLYGILVVLACAYFYVRAKNKMQEIAGNDFNFSAKNESISKHNTQNNLATVKSVNTQEYTQPSVATKVNKQVPELNVVDLDALFKEQNAKKMTEEEENAALEDFLSGFSFDDSFEQDNEIQDTNIGFDEVFYEKLLNSKNLCFSKNEMKCIHQLLGNEILDETRKNANKYAISNPLSISINKDKLIEDLVTTYAVKQNIIFKQDDIIILKKLMDVELDSDFIKDLRTSTQRTKEMEEEILFAPNEQKKPSKIKTLKVSETLPNLSEELKLHGNKKILSDYKPDTVFYSEGYEYKTLSVSSDMPNLALEIFKDDLFKYKPSAQFDILDTNYSIGNKKIKVDNKLESIEPPKDYVQNKQNTIIAKNKILEQNKSKDSQDLNAKKIETKLSNSSAMTRCIIDGESMKVVSSVSLDDSRGCYLAKKEDGYLILGYIKDKLIKLKYYDSLKSEKIQARKSETLLDGSSRFIIRIGLNKFVIDVKDDQIEYIMDLC